MGNEMYILDKDGNPILEPDVIKWGQWFENSGRHIAETKIGDVRISTVFLGLDHNFGSGLPVLYETMVFGGKLDGEMERYSTKEEAQIGHEEMVMRVVENE